MNKFLIFCSVIFLRFSVLAIVLRHHTGMSVSEVRNTVIIPVCPYLRYETPSSYRHVLILGTKHRHHTGMFLSEVRNTVLHFVAWNEPRAVNGCCTNDDDTWLFELGKISDECIR
jgi:hypothetical protein